VTLYGGHAHAVADDSMLWTPGLRLLQAWRVQQVSIETAQSKLDCSVLEKLPGKTIILGVLDLSDMNVEIPERCAAK
jgi:methionine synthase II (cobalamin-independent)